MRNAERLKCGKRATPVGFEAFLANPMARSAVTVLIFRIETVHF
jgi:hypothetical protein